MCAKSLLSCLTLCDPVDYSLPGSSVRGESPGKNIGVGCHALLHGIFLTKGLNPCLLLSPALQAGSLPAEPQGKPKYGRLKKGKDFDRNQEVGIKSHIGNEVGMNLDLEKLSQK